MKQMFNFQFLYIMIKAEDISSIYKNKENGITHTLTIDLGKLVTFNYHIERFEGVIPDLRQSDREETFNGFRPEFARRDLIKGVYNKNTMCQPVNLKKSLANPLLALTQGSGGVPSDLEDLQLMI
jgi:uncharacterized protein YjaG (DUF416 family)